MANLLFRCWCTCHNSGLLVLLIWSIIMCIQIIMCPNGSFCFWRRKFLGDSKLNIVFNQHHTSPICLHQYCINTCPPWWWTNSTSAPAATTHGIKAVQVRFFTSWCQNCCLACHIYLLKDLTTVSNDIHGMWSWCCMWCRHRKPFCHDLWWLYDGSWHWHQ